METEVRLTQYSHGSGCGCKLAPSVLTEMLKDQWTAPDANLLVGNDTRDDAAVYDLGSGPYLLSTTDFFMPVVDDPYDFGRIAAANAISDIYAMGGRPIMALAILGWPISSLSPAVAARVLAGGRHTCKEAGIAIAGGHSIDSPEPIFGLAVSGLCERENLRRNHTGRPEDLLYLTKNLGAGILTTALKRGVLLEEHRQEVVTSMQKLNRVGEELARLPCVHAMTDVTGFGLAGHLLEMCAQDLSAEIWPQALPRLGGIKDYIAKQCLPGGLERNYRSFGESLAAMPEELRCLLCDPQTSGGLLIATDPAGRAEVEQLLARHGNFLKPMGRLLPRGSLPITVKD
ncbi:MAG: selenide, water dikinase SelD [Spirochaetales bacterium]|nr:selenide, water dikinase SelD [Spirochaetales bacterium]